MKQSDTNNKTVAMPRRLAVGNGRSDSLAPGCDSIDSTERQVRLEQDTAHPGLWPPRARTVLMNPMEFTMSKKTLSVTLLACALTMACSEAGHSPMEPLPALDRAAPHHLAWDASNGPVSFSALSRTPEGETAIVPEPRFTARLSVDSLESYQASFWAVNGEPRSIQINYHNANGASSAPFLLLETTDIDSVPGVGALGVGDSVLISILVDSEDLRVTMSPAGLKFGTQAALTMWYTGAGDDLNTDGEVDQEDADIEPTLSVWMKHSTDPWVSLPTTLSTSADWAQALLDHFSGYAVSW